MQTQTTTLYCAETRAFAVFGPSAPPGGDPVMVAAGALRRSGEAWFFAHSLLQACEGFAEVGQVLLGDGAPEGEADAVFATRHAFDNACLMLAGITVDERADLFAAEAERQTEAA